MAKISGFRMAATNHYYTNEEITSEVNSRNVFYCSVHNLLSSRLPYKNVRIEVNRIIILLVLCGCQNWSVTLRVEHRLWVFENRVLRNMVGSKVDEETGGCKKLYSDRFCDLYYLSNTVVTVTLRYVRCVLQVVCCGEKGNAHN